MIAENISVAVYFKDSPNSRLEYPGIAAWVLPDGVAWMQPGYMDPYGAPSPQFHRVRGTLNNVGQHGYFAVVENDELEVTLRPADDLVSRGVRQAFEWYEQQLAKKGLERQAEALQLQEELAGALGYKRESPE
jgi:hypothetical protein